MYTVRTALLSDVGRIVDIHRTCFAGSFLTLLGKRGLAVYYGFFIEDRMGLCYVVAREDQVIGMASGWEEGSTYQRRLLRLHGGLLAACLIKGALGHPTAAARLIRPRAGILAKAAFLWAGQVRRGRHHRHTGGRPRALSDRGMGNPTNASLLSLAVLPAHRGTPAAKMLNDVFVEECGRRQAREIIVSVEKGNLRARGFYEKCGWQADREEYQSIHYAMWLADATAQRASPAPSVGSAGVPPPTSMSRP